MNKLSKLGIFVEFMCLLVFISCAANIKQPSIQQVAWSPDFYITEPDSRQCPICGKEREVNSRCRPMWMACENGHEWWALSKVLITTTEPCEKCGKN